MKVLILNGSPHENGHTFTALHEMETVFAEQGIETELIHVGKEAIRGCIDCRTCHQTGKCVFSDIVNSIDALLTRLFFSTPFDKTMKVGAAVAAARRGGLTATFDQLNKYFAISGMPIAAGCYWNGIHGMNADDAKQDGEGLYMMRTLARNMSFLMKSIALGKETYGLPAKEERIVTNFIR